MPHALLFSYIHTIYVSLMQKAKVKKVLVVSFLKINKKFHIVNVIAFVGTILTADTPKRGKACGSAGKQIFFYSNSSTHKFYSFFFLL